MFLLYIFVIFVFGGDVKYLPFSKNQFSIPVSDESRVIEWMTEQTSFPLSFSC